MRYTIRHLTNPQIFKKINFISLFLLSAVMALLQIQTSVENMRLVLFSSEKMIPIQKQTLDVPLNLYPGYYLLKIKHEIKNRQEKLVLLNGNKLRPLLERKRKIIQTDYFPIEITPLKRINLLTIAFNEQYPKNVDIRINNKYKLFIIFKDQTEKRSFSFLKFFLYAFIYYCFFSILSMALKMLSQNKPEALLYYASLPFMVIFALFSINNAARISPITLLVPDTIFKLCFLTSFLFILEIRLWKVILLSTWGILKRTAIYLLLYLLFIGIICSSAEKPQSFKLTGFLLAFSSLIFLRYALVCDKEYKHELRNLVISLLLFCFIIFVLVYSKEY